MGKRLSERKDFSHEMYIAQKYHYILILIAFAVAILFAWYGEFDMMWVLVGAGLGVITYLGGRPIMEGYMIDAIKKRRQRISVMKEKYESDKQMEGQNVVALSAKIGKLVEEEDGEMTALAKFDRKIYESLQ